MSHAPLAPSGAHRWLHCHASILAEKGFPDTETKEAMEGSAMHEVRARCLKDGTPVWDFLGDLFFGGTRLLTKCTEDRLRALIPGLDRIDDLCGDIIAHKKAEPRYVLVEERMHFEDPFLKDVYGTLDFGAYIKDAFGDAFVVISDLKFGQGVPVYAVDNEQQLIYLALFLDSLTKNERKRIKECRIIIDQPRIKEAGGEWVITVADVERWKDKVLYPAVEAINKGSKQYAPGKYACFWCKAKVACKAHTDFNVKTLGIKFDDERDGATFDVAGIEMLSAERRAYLVMHSQMVRKWLDAIHDSLLDDGLKGRDTPGLKVVDGNQGKREWADPEYAEKKMVELLGDKAFEQKLVSPTQADKLLPRKTWAGIERELVKRNPPMKKLVPLDDGREPKKSKIKFEDER